MYSENCMRVGASVSVCVLERKRREKGRQKCVFFCFYRITLEI